MGFGKCNRSCQAFRASPVASAPRKALWYSTRRDAEEHQKDDGGNAVGGDYRQRRLGDFSPWSLVSGTGSFPRVEYGTPTIRGMAGFCCHPGSRFHGCGSRALAQEKIHGRRHPAGRSDAHDPRNRSRGDAWMSCLLWWCLTTFLPGDTHEKQEVVACVSDFVCM